ncbi:MAG: HEPN domain-containing protein [Chloroflexota bacterium]
MSEKPKINVEKHIAYWRDGALEVWKDVDHSMSGRRIAFALFAAHLALEKALKAHVVKQTKNLPPMIHNLMALANLANLKLPSKYALSLVELNPMNIVARYPGETVGQIPSFEQAADMVKRAKEVLEWLIKKL